MKGVEFTSISGVCVLTTSSNVDGRGSFSKFYDWSSTTGITNKPIFENFAIAHNPRSGTLRGLHFQLQPFCESKLIFCTQGEIFDVIVDLRPKSKTFCNWASISLDAASNHSILLPEGVAHGYQTLQANTSVFYAFTSQYSEPHARVLDYSDDQLSIPWPNSVSEISKRDQQGLPLLEAAKLF